MDCKDDKKIRYSVSIPKLIDDVVNHYSDTTGFSKSSIVTMALIEYFEDCGLFDSSEFLKEFDNEEC